jgi:hypothetical protein
MGRDAFAFFVARCWLRCLVFLRPHNKYITCCFVRVARWYIFIPKILICPHFGEPWNGNEGIVYGHLEYFTAMWYILLPFGIFYGHLVYFMAIWYILWPSGKV